MNCAEVNAVIGLDAPALTPNLPGLREHLKSCRDCRSAYPEVVRLLEQQRAQCPESTPTFRQPRRHGVLVFRWAAAALVVVTLGWFGWRAVSVHPDPGESRRKDAPVAESPKTAPLGFVAGDLGTISHQSLSIQRDRQDMVTSMAAVLPASRPGDRSYVPGPK